MKQHTKQIVIGLIIGIAIGLTFSAYSLGIEYLTAEQMTVVLTERNHINTMKVTTEEGTYRIFTIESTDNKGGVGISAIKIK